MNNLRTDEMAPIIIHMLIAYYIQTEKAVQVIIKLIQFTRD